jgi:diacylglycerol kinase (ATP)
MPQPTSSDSRSPAPRQWNYPRKSPTFKSSTLMGESQPPLPTPLGSKPNAAHTRHTHAWQIAPDLLTSFRFAGAGLVYAFTTQRNFRIHTFVTIALLAVSVWLKLSAVEVAILALTAAAVLALELINTAIESLVDLTVGKTYHDLAKIAKDCAAGAVLVAAIASLLVGFIIVVPPFLARIALF